MIVERVVGRVTEADQNLDWVDIDWKQTVRRALRLRSRQGRRVDVLLGPGERLRHGDLLVESPEHGRVAVYVTPCETVVLRPANITHMGLAATELGNLHWPVEIADDCLITIDDGPVREIAERWAIPFEIQQRRFHPIPASVLTPLVKAQG